MPSKANKRAESGAEKRARKKRAAERRAAEDERRRADARRRAEDEQLRQRDGAPSASLGRTSGEALPARPARNRSTGN